MSYDRTAHISSSARHEWPWLVEARNISKRFGRITALQDVDLEVGHGEIVGLLGDKGAGKSTLVKVLSGVYPPDEGQLVWDGQPIRLSSPRDAMELGISTVYQDLAIVDTMSIFRNVFLGREEEVRGEKGPIRLLQPDKARSEARKALQNIGMHVRSVDEPAANLSSGERQSIAIARAIYFEAKLLIMDEPCSALGPKETAKALMFVEKAREQGASVIFITHDVDQVYPIAGRFTILSYGKSLGSFSKSEYTKEQITELIIRKRQKV